MRKTGALLIVFLIMALSTGAQPLAKNFDAGVTQFENGNYNEAIQLFTQVINADKGYHEAYYYRARCQVALSKNELALLDFARCLEITPSFYPALYFRAEFYFRQADFPNALKDLDKAIVAKPNLAEAWFLRGKVHMQTKSWAEALKQFNSAEELGVKRLELYMLRGQCRIQMGLYLEAEKDFDQALLINPGHGEAYFQRGYCKYMRHLYSAGLKDFETATRNKYRSEELYRLRAELYLKMRKWNLANSDLDTLIKDYKVNSDTVHLNKGIALYGMKEYDDAISSFNKAYFLNRNNANAVTYRGDCFAMQGKNEEAIAEYNRAINMDPKNARAFTQRGILSFLKHDYQAALKDLDTGIKLEPSSDAYYYRGACKNALNDMAGACVDLKKSADMGNTKAIYLMKSVCN